MPINYLYHLAWCGAVRYAVHTVLFYFWTRRKSPGLHEPSFLKDGLNGGADQGLYKQPFSGLHWIPSKLSWVSTQNSSPFLILYPH